MTTYFGPFTLYSDPGHGWLEVKWTALHYVCLHPSDFSTYSYRQGNTFYLEEDCDAPKFLAAYKKVTGRDAVVHDRYVDHDSFIRHLEPIYA